MTLIIGVRNTHTQWPFQLCCGGMLVHFTDADKYIHKSIYTCIHTYIHTYIHRAKNLHSYIHTNIHSCICTHIQLPNLLSCHIVIVQRFCAKRHDNNLHKSFFQTLGKITWIKKWAWSTSFLVAENCFFCVFAEGTNLALASGAAICMQTKNTAPGEYSVQSVKSSQAISASWFPDDHHLQVQVCCPSACITGFACEAFICLTNLWS